MDYSQLDFIEETMRRVLDGTSSDRDVVKLTELLESNVRYKAHLRDEFPLLRETPHASSDISAACRSVLTAVNGEHSGPAVPVKLPGPLALSLDWLGQFSTPSQALAEAYARLDAICDSRMGAVLPLSEERVGSEPCALAAASCIAACRVMAAGRTRTLVALGGRTAASITEFAVLKAKIEAANEGADVARVLKRKRSAEDVDGLNDN